LTHFQPILHKSILDTLWIFDSTRPPANRGISRTVTLSLLTAHAFSPALMDRAHTIALSIGFSISIRRRYLIASIFPLRA
jgi:hypothetical protein